jgi:hypothetical protein
MPIVSRKAAAFALALLSLEALPRSAFAQSRGAKSAAQKSAAATVEGDVYLVMQNGDTKRGAGRTVMLLRDDDGKLRTRANLPCLELELKISPLRQWLAALPDTERMARSGQQGLPSMYDLAARRLRIEKGIAEFKDAARRAMLTELAVALVDSVGTGMNANYRLTVTRPGNYVLFSEWTIGDNVYAWWAPITIAAGQSLKRDLDNSVADSKLLACGR